MFDTMFDTMFVADWLCCLFLLVVLAGSRDHEDAQQEGHPPAERLRPDRGQERAREGPRPRVSDPSVLPPSPN